MTVLLLSFFAKAQSSGKDSLLEKLYGTASYYAQKFEGRRTANGSIFKHNKMTAACNRLPMGTRVLVRNLKNNKTIEVVINDRLARRNKRIIDLSLSAARKLAMLGAGLVQVEITVLKIP